VVILSGARPALHREATVTVGRHLTPLGRWLLAQEIRRALVHSRASPRW